jgi:hypothetical protein
VEAEEEVLTTYLQDAWDLIPNILLRIPAQIIMQAAGCSKRAAYFYRRSNENRGERRGNCLHNWRHDPPAKSSGQAANPSFLKTTSRL